MYIYKYILKLCLYKCAGEKKGSKKITGCMYGKVNMHPVIIVSAYNR